MVYNYTLDVIINILEMICEEVNVRNLPLLSIAGSKLCTVETIYVLRVTLT